MYEEASGGWFLPEAMQTHRIRYCVIALSITRRGIQTSCLPVGSRLRLVRYSPEFGQILWIAELVGVIVVQYPYDPRADIEPPASAFSARRIPSSAVRQATGIPGFSVPRAPVFVAQPSVMIPITTGTDRNAICA